MSGLKGIRLPADLGSLPRFIDYVTRRAEERGLPAERVLEVQLVVEEALVNVFQYAFPDGKGEVELLCGPGSGGSLRIEIRDEGVPFDPTGAPDPDITAGVEERTVGGLGILLIKKISRSVTYRREGGRNILTLEIQ